MSESLQHFLDQWDQQYIQRLQKIKLFDANLTKDWTQDQKVHFAKLFYHARGHFHEFLWYVGNHADNKMIKDIILKNIKEEMNGAAKSHEQLYMDFAQSLGADLSNELVDGESYIDFIKEFNKGHLRWLHAHDNEARFAAFAAYERLDNVDYMSLLELVNTLTVSRKGLLFFKVHLHATHFKSTKDFLNILWATSLEKVKDAFHFISDHQIKMWNDLSDIIFGNTMNEMTREGSVKCFKKLANI